MGVTVYPEKKEGTGYVSHTVTGTLSGLARAGPKLKTTNTK